MLQERVHLCVTSSILLHQVQAAVFFKTANNKWNHHPSGCPHGHLVFHSSTVARDSLISQRILQMYFVFLLQTLLLQVQTALMPSVPKKSSVHPALLEVQSTPHANPMLYLSNQPCGGDSREKWAFEAFPPRLSCTLEPRWMARRRPAENPRHPWINGQVIYDIRLGRGRLHLSSPLVSSPYNAMWFSSPIRYISLCSRTHFKKRASYTHTRSIISIKILNGTLSPAVLNNLWQGSVHSGLTQPYHQPDHAHVLYIMMARCLLLFFFWFGHYIPSL